MEHEIEISLQQHPHVKAAALMESEDASAPPLAYIVPDMVALRARAPAKSSPARNEIIDRWNKLYEMTYSAGPPAPSFVGWNSSYTRQPIPEVEMREWLDTTVQRIRALNPRKVLEIGCGVGLLLQNLAPHCEEYVGTDLSASALRHVQRWIGGREELQHVRLLHRLATDLEELPSGSFDTIVINSVVQYFPDIDYLLAVLGDAARLLMPGGNLFIGDVRHFGHLPTFHSAIQLTRAADSATVAQLRRRVARAVAQETELPIDPAFFEAVVQRVPRFASAEIRLRRGVAHNELTRYRYDVVLHVGDKVVACADTPQAAWGADLGSTAAFEDALTQVRWSDVLVHSIPNARLSRDRAARHLIETSDARSNARELRAAWNAADVSGVDPEWLCQRAESLGYSVSIGWGPDGYFQARLSNRATTGTVPGRAFVAEADLERPWSDYANSPLDNRLAQQLLLDLREYLKSQFEASAMPTEWSIVPRLPTARRSLDALFTRSLERFPDRPCLFVAGRLSTYRELEADCRAIEESIRRRGLADSGRRVGLIYARSQYSYAAIIAILRANCVYVPLNPKAPAERLLKVIADAGIDAILVDQADELSDEVRSALLQRPANVQVISSTDAVDASSVIAPEASEAPPAIAYIIYTSGSTGVPKGVAISHESACRCMEKVEALFEATEQDRFTQFCALSFDYSLVEIFVCWKAGAALFVPAAAEALVPLNFAIAHEITVWFSVPSLASFLLKLGLLKENVLPHVRLSLFGGEALPFELVHSWAVAAPGGKILNLYGPTEVTIVSTSYLCDVRTAPHFGTVPIGTTLPDLSFRIVESERIVEVEGQPGELWLSGDQLAKGYWNNTAATEAAFVRSMSIDGGTSRWYRTGDLVSFKKGVGIGFHGRLDRQVKLRGLRIELQEIEAVLREVAGCAIAAVVPIRNAAGLCERITAYCDRLTADEAVIRERCLARLPPYMIPERVTELEEFPLSGNGKIDYLALAAHARESLTSNAGAGFAKSARPSTAPG